MRVKSAIWVAAAVRRAFVEGLFAAVMKHGADEAGAIFVKVNRLDGTVDLYGPAPQSAFAQDGPMDRSFELLTAAGPEAEIEARLAREAGFDPDLWVVEIESRDGRHFLDLAAKPDAAPRPGW